MTLDRFTHCYSHKSHLLRYERCGRPSGLRVETQERRETSAVIKMYVAACSVLHYSFMGQYAFVCSIVSPNYPKVNIKCLSAINTSYFLFVVNVNKTKKPRCSTPLPISGAVSVMSP